MPGNTKRRQELAMEARSLGTHTPEEWLALVTSVGKRCFYCGRTCGGRGGRALTRDHKVPINRGGSDSILNIVVACRLCNSIKGDLTIDELMALREQGYAL